MSKTRGKWISGGKIKIADVIITDGKHTSPPNPAIDDHLILDKRGLFVIHSVMLHTGKVLWFCGHVEDGHYALKSYLFDYKKPSAQLISHDFPVHNSALARTSPLGKANNPNTGHFHADLFCCHFVHAADGKVVVVGGSDPDFSLPGNAGHSSVGETYIYIFDPDANNRNGKWEVAQKGSNISRLKQGRWYPTAVLLGDGRIMVTSGRQAFGTGGVGTTRAQQNRDRTAETVEILTPPHYASTTLKGADMPLPLYPGLHLVPDGKKDGRIYYTHTTWGLEFDPPAFTLSIKIPPWATSASWKVHSTIAPKQPEREEGMSVLLPPAQDGKILLIGGGAANAAGGIRHLQAERSPPVTGEYPSFDDDEDGNHHYNSELLQTIGGPKWKKGPDLWAGRTNGHAVILPNKKVLIFGGHDHYKWSLNSTQSVTSELYNPATNTVKKMAKLKHARMYHSAAVLLPNGTVLVAGGADPDPNQNQIFDDNEWSIHNSKDGFSYPANWEGPLIYDKGTVPANTSMAYNRKDYEIYKPTYFYKKEIRPKIDKVQRKKADTTLAFYGGKLTVISEQAADIKDVAFIRPGAATHHTDTEQRYVDLKFTRSGNRLEVTMPTNRNLAPPGYYMLWIISKKGQPCKEAKFVRLAEPDLDPFEL